MHTRFLLFCRYLWLPFLLAPVGAETLGVRVFTVTGSEARTLSFWNGEGFETLRASTVQPSPALRLPAANPLPVFLDPRPGPDGAPPMPAARVALPEDASRILLLVAEDPEGGTPRFMAMEDDLEEADERDWLFLNLTPSAIALQVGEGTEPILLAPRSRFLRRLEVENGVGAPVMAVARIEGEMKTFYSTYWAIRAGRRSLVLCVPAGEGRIQVRRIDERIPKGQRE
jgi:hypothetical protein